MSEDCGPSTLMQATERILLPWVAFLLRKGVRYTTVIPLLKNVFLKAAAEELAQTGQVATASALSVLSGVHRKDVRQWLEDGRLGRQDRAADIANLVWTLWKQDSTWSDRLPEHGAAASFAALVRSVSKDVHPYTVACELERLNLLRREDEGWLCRIGDAFIPPAGSVEALNLLTDTLQDHLLTGTHNLDASQGQGMLEQSIFAEPLSQESVQELEQLARSEWQRMQEILLNRARSLWLRDQQQASVPKKQDAQEINNRFRLGVFSYRGVIQSEPAKVEPAGEQD